MVAIRYFVIVSRVIARVDRPLLSSALGGFLS